MPGRVASFWPSPGTHSNGVLAPTMNSMPAGRKQPGPPPGGLDALAALGEPTRRALYGFVVAQDRPVSRDEAAAATGTKRATATFHLERLVDDGLLEARFARVSGRTGPGAGRTAKLYERAARQFAVSLPPRQYEIAGEVLASALELLQCRAAPAGEAVAQAASQAGRQLTAGSTDLAELLSSVGLRAEAGSRGVHSPGQLPIPRTGRPPSRPGLHDEPAPARRPPWRTRQRRAGAARPGRGALLRHDRPALRPRCGPRPRHAALCWPRPRHPALAGPGPATPRSR